jgi:hypothetical protein
MFHFFHIFKRSKFHRVGHGSLCSRCTGKGEYLCQLGMWVFTHVFVAYQQDVFPVLEGPGPQVSVIDDTRHTGIAIQQEIQGRYVGAVLWVIVQVTAVP